MADPDPKPDDPPADPPADPPKDPPPADPPKAKDDDEPLGEGGKRALEAERKARRDAETARKALEDELAELKKAGLSEQEKAIEDAKTAGATEAAAKYAALIVAAEVKAAGASKVAPEALDDLPRLLDLDPTKLVSDDGTVDTKAISSAIDEMVKAKPYLAPKAGGGGGADPDQGARGGGRPAQLTRDALRNMTSEEIAQARRDGRLDDLMAGLV